MFYFIEASNFTLNSDWQLTNHSLVLQVGYVKSPNALNEAVQNWHLLHLPKSTQFNHPYCLYVKKALYDPCEKLSAHRGLPFLEYHPWDKMEWGMYMK